jgi:hypothetical protein
MGSQFFQIIGKREQKMQATLLANFASCLISAGHKQLDWSTPVKFKICVDPQPSEL